jgi:hypothetical protein
VSKQKANADSVAWQDCPPATVTPFVPILSPRAGAQLRGLILADKLVGVMTHWLDERTTPCTRPRSTCRGCKDCLKRRWKGYLPVLALGPDRLALFELTPLAASGAGIGDPNNATALRGLYVVLSRRAGQRNGRVACAVSAPPAEYAGVALPAPFDARAALARVWGVRPCPPATGTEDGEGQGGAP